MGVPKSLMGADHLITGRYIAVMYNTMAECNE